MTARISIPALDSQAWATAGPRTARFSLSLVHGGPAETTAKDRRNGRRLLKRRGPCVGAQITDGQEANSSMKRAFARRPEGPMTVSRKPSSPAPGAQLRRELWAGIAYADMPWRHGFSVGRGWGDM